MKVSMWTAVVLSLALVGCKGHQTQQMAQLNSDGLSVSQADTLLAQPAEVGNQQGMALPPANVVVNTEVQVAAEAPMASLPVSVTDTPDAKMIQQALKNLGLYEGEVDGKLGPKSKEAIRKFQEQNNLTADGKVGPKTWAVLRKALEAGTVSSATPVQN